MVIFIFKMVAVRRLGSVQFLQFCQFSRWRPLQSCILEIAKFYSLTGSVGLICSMLPNFVKICQPVAEISIFFNFLRWRLYAILDFFGGTLGSPTKNTLTVQDLVAIDAVVLIV